MNLLATVYNVITLRSSVSGLFFITNCVLKIIVGHCSAVNAGQWGTPL